MAISSAMCAGSRIVFPHGPAAFHCDPHFACSSLALPGTITRPSSFGLRCSRKEGVVDILFSGWASLSRLAVVGPLAYVALIVMLRISGKRTLAKFNAFDFVVTVALGSTLSSVLLDNSISLSEGLTAFGLLILLQFVIAFVSVRSAWFESLVKSRATLLVEDGRYLEEEMLAQRVTREEVNTALRQNGLLQVKHRSMTSHMQSRLSSPPRRASQGRVRRILTSGP